MAIKKRALGRGLDALMGTLQTPILETEKPMIPEGELRRLPIEFITANPDQPRRHFDEAALEELAESIRAQGMIQPILVRPTQQGRYEIIAGERRFRAAQRAELSEIPAIIRSNASEETLLALALIENMQREDLHPLEEAEAIQNLLTQCELSHEEVGATLGKSRASISNLLRLLQLSPSVKSLFMQGHLDMGHARAILSLPADQQLFLAEKIAAQKLSVRETELWTHRLQNPLLKTTPEKHVSPDIRSLQETLSNKLAASVLVKHGSRGRGKLVITYNSLDELDGILSHIH